MATDKTTRLYRVIFANKGETYELYAAKVYAADLPGFVTIEDLRFRRHTGVVIDPAEDRLRTEFKGVKRFFISMHSVVRVDEVEKPGAAKIGDLDDKVTPFPLALPPRKNKAGAD